MEILSYIFGILGIASTIVIYQQKKRVGLLLSKLVSDVIWLVYYVSLAAYSGAAIAAIGFVRELIFMNKDKKWARSPFWLVLFILLSIASGILTWENIFSIFPCIASILSVVSFWIGRPRLARILAFPITACMLTYAIASMAYLAIGNEILTFASTIIGIIRLDLNKKNKQDRMLKTDINS